MVFCFVLQKQTITAVRKEVIRLPVLGKFDFKSSNKLYVLCLYALHSVMRWKPCVQKVQIIVSKLMDSTEWQSIFGKLWMLRLRIWDTLRRHRCEGHGSKCCRVSVPPSWPLLLQLQGCSESVQGGSLLILANLVSRAQHRALVIISRSD